MERLRVVAVHGHRDRRLARHVVLVEHAHEPEVEEADAAVVEQQVVAGMRVARDAAHVVDEAEVEAEDDLPHAVARRLVARLTSSKRAPRISSVTSTRRLESSVKTSGT